MDIAKWTIKAWDESVRISRIRLDHGDISKLDLKQFEAERANTAAQLADLEQAEQQLAAATANIGVAPAQRFLTVSLTGSAGVSSFQLTGQASQGPFATFGVIGSLSGPLLNATAVGY